MTNRRNIFSRFFRLLVMLHKISYAHFTEWNNKRKRKAFAAGIYFLSILPEFVLLAGTFLAARGQDGYVHLVNVPQKVVFYGLAGLAVLLSAIPLGFFDDKKICKEVRQELRERPRYWKRAIAVYWAVIVAMVATANIVFPTFSDKTMPPENERTEVPQRWRDYLSLRFAIVARQETPNEVLQRLIDQDGRTTRYGKPVYAMQVRKEDMAGEFRVGLLSHATFEEIRDGRRKFVECTWVKGYTPDSSPITDGIPQEELALFIGKKSAVIMPKFIKMEITNSKVSWCWPAAILGFLFGPMGAALWFFYRKMYKTGALLAVIGALINIIVAVLTFNTTSADYTLLYRSFLSGDMQSVLNALSSIGSTSTLLDVIADVISSAADLATCILTGLFGYYLYKEHCIKVINNFRMNISDRRYYTMGLASVGGVSGGMLAVGIICIVVVNNLTSAVTAVISML